MTERFTENTETKPGIFTTEFYVAVATILCIVLDAIPSPERFEGPIAALIAAVYALSRGIAKNGVQHYGPARQEPDLDLSELEPGDLEGYEPGVAPARQ